MQDHAAPLTRHARVRCHQRAVSDRFLDLILTYGACRRRGHADSYLIPRKRLAQLVRDGVIVAGDADRLCGIYVIVSDDGAVITVAHDTRTTNRAQPQRRNTSESRKQLSPGRLHRALLRPMQKTISGVSA